jgi:hypothetical protein
MKKGEVKRYKVDFETEEQAKAFRQLLKVLGIKEIKDPEEKKKPANTSKVGTRIEKSSTTTKAKH